MDNETKWVIGALLAVILMAVGLLYAIKAQTLACYKDHSSRPVAEIKILCSL